MILVFLSSKCAVVAEILAVDKLKLSYLVSPSHFSGQPNSHQGQQWTPLNMSDIKDAPSNMRNLSPQQMLSLKSHRRQISVYKYFILCSFVASCDGPFSDTMQQLKGHKYNAQQSGHI